MFVAALVALTAAIPFDSSPVLLRHLFTAGEKVSYRVQSNLGIQFRGRGLDTWMPQEVGMKYDFTTVTQKLKADGIAEVRYMRPSITTIEDEGEVVGPKRTVEKKNWDALLTLSPLNKVLDLKDLTKGGTGIRTIGIRPVARIQGEDAVDDFLGEIYRLALFAGGLDTSLDLAPPLPLRAVSPGDEWKATVSYQPQKLKGKGDKQAVQRLDFTYTYQGVVQTPKGHVHRVVGKLALSTDLADFVRQALADDPEGEQIGLTKLPMALDASVEFDLDPKTMRTLVARASSQGGISVHIDEFPDRPIIEEKFKGTTTLSLLSVNLAAAPKKASKPPR